MQNRWECGKRLGLATLGACLLAGWLVLGAAAAEPEAAASESGSESKAPRPLDRTSPRGALYGYLVAARHGDYEQAASYLNLSPVRADLREQRGPRLARSTSRWCSTARCGSISRP